MTTLENRPNTALLVVMLSGRIRSSRKPTRAGPTRRRDGGRPGRVETKDVDFGGASLA
jgi:hypothetical protein